MEDNSAYIAQIYRDMELELIRSMKKNLGLHLSEEKKTDLKYPQWQAIKLKELQRYQNENRDIIKKHTATINDEISQHMQSELREGKLSEIKKFREALGDRYVQSKAMRDGFFGVDDLKVSAMIESLTNDISKANTAVFRMTNDIYRQTISKYAMFVSNGVYTEKKAYDASVKDFLEKGINCIEYKNGRRVNIADYASMAVRTANQRAYMVGQGELRKQMGRTLILISKHNTSCKLCYPFERKVLIDDVYSGGKASDGDYMLLSEAMKRGLYHPRCRHGCSTYFPELDVINKEYGNDYSNVAVYDDTEYQKAHIENMVQKYKRLTEGSVDPENVKMYREKLKEWEERKPEPVDITHKKQYNYKADKMQFEKYQTVLRDLSPGSLDEFETIKYENPDEWRNLKHRYRILNQYKIDSGYISAKDLIELDNIVISEKREMFTSDFKKSGNIAGAYLDGNKEKMFFAHSSISSEEKCYKGKHKLILLKNDRRFEYIDVKNDDGTTRTDTFYDTEAKLFEYFANEYEKKPFKSITMLSERGMCDSCKGVMEQFKKRFPGVTMNVVSNKKVSGNVWKNRRRNKK